MPPSPPWPFLLSNAKEAGQRMRIVSRSTQPVAERRPHSPAPSPSGHPLAPERSSDLKPPHNVPKSTLERYAFMAMGESALVRHPAPLAEPFQGCSHAASIPTGPSLGIAQSQTARTLYEQKCSSGGSACAVLRTPLVDAVVDWHGRYSSVTWSDRYTTVTRCSRCPRTSPTCRPPRTTAC
jgi:hypothetical protein